MMNAEAPGQVQAGASVWWEAWRQSASTSVRCRARQLTLPNLIRCARCGRALVSDGDRNP